MYIYIYVYISPKSLIASLFSLGKREVFHRFSLLSSLLGEVSSQGREKRLKRERLLTSPKSLIAFKRALLLKGD